MSYTESNKRVPHLHWNEAEARCADRRVHTLPFETKCATPALTRRGFLAASAAAGAAGWLPLPSAVAAKPVLGKAEHCIFLWLGGGMGQMDTWDPKAKGDPTAKNAPGSYYDSIPTAAAGVRVCKHLGRCANLLDRFTIVRTVNHDVVDEHAAATNRMHTGRPTSGTIIYPSIGSIVSHERGAGNKEVPAYVVIGYPNVTRGPGFLGARHSYLYLIDTASGPAVLNHPPDVTQARQARRQTLLDRLRRSHLDRVGSDQVVRDYHATLEQSVAIAGPQFMSTFQLDKEPAELRESYGSEFGQRCLLARRLIQRGVRFVEVAHNLNFLNGTGWDVHNEGILNQHLLIEELDGALATLVLDLEQQKLLDKTLVVVSTEFGRPAEFDGRGGRGHYAKSFSVVLAGGGLRHRGALGETDEKAMKILSRPVSAPDLFATIFATLGIDPGKELHDGDRPVPITDMGQPIGELFA